MWKAIYRVLDDIESNVEIEVVQFYMRGENLYNAPSVVIWYRKIDSGFRWAESLG